MRDGLDHSLLFTVQTGARRRFKNDNGQMRCAVAYVAAITTPSRSIAINRQIVCIRLLPFTPHMYRLHVVPCCILRAMLQSWGDDVRLGSLISMASGQFQLYFRMPIDGSVRFSLGSKSYSHVGRGLRGCC